MDDRGESGRRLIDRAAQERFLEALRSGAPREQAAAAAGFPLNSLYNVRARDPVFRLAWSWALDLAAIDERGGELSRRTADGEPARIAPRKGRLLQRQRMRWVKFTDKRQQIYLDHFAGTADCEAAAAAAGVTTATVRAHARRHPEFAAARSEALRHAYAVLEAEAVRQRLEAQRRFAEDLEPRGEMAQEFERVMKLLARYERRDGRIAMRERSPLPSQAWTFEAAIAALDKALDSIGVRRDLLPAPAPAPAPEDEERP
ncbi:hypothetical protein [Allosphingosinicella sp.]|uniref:hypothetical protein n=1 Tax=Allosphingosinicella sp. TaxID=2823234 RepID=UPI002F165A4C